MNKKLVLALFLLVSTAYLSKSQNVNGLLFDATNTATRDASAAFEINANTNTPGSPLYGGLLPPRVALTGTSDVATISGTEATGLTVFNTATAGDVTPGYYYWSGSAWVRMLSGSFPTTVKWNAITDPDGALTLNHGTNATTFNFANTTTSGWGINYNSLTSGTGLTVGSTATAFTGTLAGVSLTGNAAANTGNVFKVSSTGASNQVNTMVISHGGNNIANTNALRINDDGTDTDPDPMIVNYAGNVGIGTTDVSNKLEVHGTAAASINLLLVNEYAGYASQRLRTSKGTPGARTAVSTNDFIGDIVYEGYDGNSYEEGAGIRAKVEAASNSTGILPTGLYFRTRDNVSTTSATTNMVINNTGNVGIGSYFNSNLATSKLHIDGGGTGTAVAQKFTAGTTLGQTATDGFDLGVDASGNAEIRQRENLPITFYTNNTSQMVLSNAGVLSLSGVNQNDLVSASSIRVGTTTATAATAGAGAIRYNSDDLEFSDGTNWIAVNSSNNSATTRWDQLLAPTANLSLAHANYTTSFTFNTVTTGTAWNMTSNGLTSGKLFDLNSAATAFTGTLAHATLSGSNAANTGTVMKVTNSGAANTGTAMMVTNLGAGAAFRVNDETGDADATPFIISSNGSVGVGNTAPTTKVDITGGARFGGRNYFTKTVSVSNTVFVELTNQNGAALSTSSVYSVKLVTTGTGTDTGAEYLVWYDATLAAWQVRAVAISGTNSNHPALFIDAGVVKVRNYHASNYNTNVFVEEIEAGIADVTGHIYGTHYNWQRTGTNLYYNDGNVGIGVSPSTTYKLEVNGKLKTAGIDENSDARLKKDVNPIEEALQKVNQMRGVTYNWRTEEFPERNFEKDMQFGLIAQELEKVIPELVTTDDDGYKAIEYSHLVPVLIEAIKELDAKNNEQKVQLDQQTKTNDELKASIENLLIRMNAMENNIENKTNKAEK